MNSLIVIFTFIFVRFQWRIAVDAINHTSKGRAVAQQERLHNPPGFIPDRQLNYAMYQKTFFQNQDIPATNKKNRSQARKNRKNTRPYDRWGRIRHYTKHNPLASKYNKRRNSRKSKTTLLDASHFAASDIQGSKSKQTKKSSKRKAKQNRSKHAHRWTNTETCPFDYCEETRIQTGIIKKLILDHKHYTDKLRNTIVLQDRKIRKLEIFESIFIKKLSILSRLVFDSKKKIEDLRSRKLHVNTGQVRKPGVDFLKMRKNIVGYSDTKKRAGRLNHTLYVVNSTSAPVVKDSFINDMWPTEIEE